MITLQNGSSFNSDIIGNSLYPEWLLIKVATGGINLNNGVSLFGHLVVPDGNVAINSNAALYGSLSSKRLNLNSDGLIIGIPFDTEPPQNESPTADDASISLNEDGVLPFTLTGSDPEGAPLAFAVTVNPVSGVLSGTAPNLTYTPNLDFNGSDQLTFIVNDGEQDSSPAIISITVNPINDAPIAVTQTLNTPEDTDLQITLTGTDIENDPLTFSVTQNPINGHLSGTAPHLTYTPDPDYAGSDSFFFIANDGSLDSEAVEVTLSVSEVNDAPGAVALDYTLDEDTSAIVTLEGDDIDSDDLEFTLVSLPANGILELNTLEVTTVPITVLLADSLIYYPNADFDGSDAFIYEATDGLLVSGEATVSLNINPINDDPVLLTTQFTTTEDNPLDEQLLAEDIDGDSLSFTLNSGASLGMVSINSDGTFSYIPTTDANGADSFVVDITDAGGSNPFTVFLQIDPINDAPTATPISTSTPEEISVGILLQGDDIDGDALIFQISNPPADGILTGIPPNMTYTPDQDFNGTDSFSYLVSDGLLNSAPEDVDITVTPVNDPPIGEALAFVVNEDEIAPIPFNPFDADGDALSIEIVSLPSSGSLEDTVGNPLIVGSLVSGTLEIDYLPSLNFHGADSFTYLVTDGSLNSGIFTVSLDVLPVNDAPVVVALTANTLEDNPVAILLQGSDDDGDALVFEVVTQPGAGLLSGSEPHLTYSPDPHVFGIDSFTYRASDGTLFSDTVTVSVNIAAVNDAPVADAFADSTSEGVALNGQLTASDADGDTLTFAKATDPANGTVTVNPDGSFIYTPDANFDGSDSFTFIANDGTVDSVPAVAAITVTEVNEPPVAVAQTATTEEDTEVQITLQGTDPNGDPLTYIVNALPNAGSLTDSLGNPVVAGVALPDAIVSYTPNPDFYYNDVIFFHVSDGQLDSGSESVIIGVTPAARTKTWSTSAEFAEGAIHSLISDPADQLQLGVDGTLFNYLWVPVSSKGTITYIDIESARVLGEFRSAPSDNPVVFSKDFPSRVTLDDNGNAWIANRNSGLVVKLTPPNGNWRDKNGNLQLDTSGGLDEILPWTITESGALTAIERADLAEDELITLAIDTGITNALFLDVGPDGNVWVGSPSALIWRQFDGETGVLLREETAPIKGLGGYGGFIDANGVLYSTGTVPLKWDTRLPITSYDLVWAETHREDAWDIVLDFSGQFWESKDWNQSIYRYDSTGTLLDILHHNLRWAMGMTVDFDDQVWLAHSHCSNWVSRWLNDGTYIGKVEVANHGPTDVTVDRRGYVWSTGTPGLVQRINPLAGPMGKDGQTPVGEVDLQTPYLGGNIWAFGEFAGVSASSETQEGSWTAVFDGEIPNTAWGPVVWNADLCNDAMNVVEVSFSSNGSSWGSWETIAAVGDRPTGTGRYIRIRVSMISADSGESPILKDLTVGTDGYTAPTAADDWYVDAGSAINAHWPDPIQMKGALCFTQSFNGLLAPTYLWTVDSASDTVTFSDATALRPHIEFGGPGDYTLRLTATDGSGVRVDTVTIHLDPYNKAPYVNAGDNAIVLNAGENFQLLGEVRDDGLPEPPSLTILWEQKFGPGTVTFSDTSDPLATASFSAPGIYLLQLSADDGEFQSQDSSPGPVMVASTG